jgi:hypothetical protein
MHKIYHKTIDQIEVGDIVTTATKCTDSAMLRIGVVSNIVSNIVDNIITIKTLIPVLNKENRIVKYRLNQVTRSKQYRRYSDVIYKGDLLNSFSPEEINVLKSSYTRIGGNHETIFDYISNL